MKEELLKIINHYGTDNQKRKLVEEVYELLDALAEINYSSSNFSNNVERMINHVVEEMADVLVLIEQFRLYWNIDMDDIEKIFKQKVIRTINEIGAENEKLLRSATRIRSSKKQTKKS